MNEREKSAKQARRERTAAFLADPDAIDEVLEFIAQGESLRDYCVILDIAYSTVQQRLTEDPELAPRYEAARLHQAETVLSEIRAIEVKLENDHIDAKAAAVLIGSKQWRAERLNSKRYGQRQQIDMNVTATHKLHLEAVRTLARRPRELPRSTIIDAEIVAPAPAPALTHEPAQLLPVTIEQPVKVEQS